MLIIKVNCFNNKGRLAGLNPSPLPLRAWRHFRMIPVSIIFFNFSWLTLKTFGYVKKKQIVACTTVDNSVVYHNTCSDKGVNCKKISFTKTLNCQDICRVYKSDQNEFQCHSSPKEFSSGHVPQFNSIYCSSAYWCILIVDVLRKLLTSTLVLLMI